MPNEYEKLDVELRALRGKKSDAEKEIKDLFNKKIALLEENKKLRLDTMIARDASKVENDRLGVVKKNKAELDKAHEVEARKLKDEKKSLLSLRDSIASDMEAIKMERRASDTKITLIKQREDIVKVREADSIAKAKELKDGEKEIIDGKALLRQSLADLEDKKRILLKREDSFSTSLDDAQRTKSLLEMKLAEVEAQKNDLKDARASLDSLKKQLEAKDESQAKTDILLSAKQDELNKKLKSVDMTKQALEVQAKEIERDKLRFQKLAREKGLDKELKELKKALA